MPIIVEFTSIVHKFAVDDLLFYQFLCISFTHECFRHQIFHESALLWKKCPPYYHGSKLKFFIHKIMDTLPCCDGSFRVRKGKSECWNGLVSAPTN